MEEEEPEGMGEEPEGWGRGGGEGREEGAAAAEDHETRKVR